MKFLVSRKKLEVEENDGKKKEYTDRQTDRSDCIETPLLDQRDISYKSNDSFLHFEKPDRLPTGRTNLVKRLSSVQHSSTTPSKFCKSLT